jgi:hypothetical protein
MTGGIVNRVKIGTCSGPAEAAFVRSVFDAHDLPVVINGEMHSNALGGLGGFIQLDIFVDRDDAEDALALLSDIRAGEHAVPEGEDPEAAASDEGADAGDERGDADGVWDARQETMLARAVEAPPAIGADPRRRSTGAVLLLSGLLGFGAGHMSTGAWGRGIAIAAVNVFGFQQVLAGDPVLGGWLLFGARFGDLIGALWRVWSRPAPGRS